MSADIAAALGRPLSPWQEQILGHVLTGRPLQIQHGSRRGGKAALDCEVMALVIAAGWHWHFARHDGTWCTGPDYCKDLKRMEAPPGLAAGAGTVGI